jgi:alkanesulfonate monooxygenase SsuD/methylene tetrahydromethanopterin reductase-like flavin-dependent oxidoreductase (luciferase family)
MVAGTSHETISWAVREGTRLLLSLEPREARQLAILDEVRRELGEHGPRRVSFSRYVCIGATPEQAEERAVRLWRAIQANRRVIAEQRGQVFAERPFDEFCAEQVIVGDGHGCIRAIDQLIAEQQMDHLRCVFNGNGAVSAAETLDQMQLFSEAVLNSPEAREWRPNRE